MIQSKLKKLLNLYTFALMTALLSVVTHSQQAVPGEELPKKHGYLLIELDVGGIAPSLEYAKRGMYGLSSKRHIIPLKGIDTHFLLLTIPKGHYQVTAINAPLFDLPYEYNTSEYPHWAFKVEADAINYFGKLIIEKERSTDSVRVARQNHIAKTLTDINTQYAAILLRYSMINASGYRDDFFNEINTK